MKQEKLREVMKKQGRLKNWIAKNLGIHPSNISFWLSGTRNIPDKYKSKIAELLGVPEKILF